MSAEELAHAVSLRTRSLVPVSVITAACEGGEIPRDEVTAAIAATLNGDVALFADTPEGADLQNRLYACAFIRDRYSDGGPNIIARGSAMGARQIEEVLDFLDRQPELLT